MPRISLRTRERDMDGNELEGATIPADSYLLEASGLPANALLRVTAAIGQGSVSRDFTADQDGVIGETVQVQTPAMLAVLPYIQGASWDDGGTLWKAGVSGVTITVEIV